MPEPAPSTDFSSDGPPGGGAVRDLALRPGPRALAQVAGLAGLWWGADHLMRLLRLPVPGSVAGLGLVVLALRRGWLPLGWVKDGADWLLAEMLLFFIPAVVAVVQYPALLLREGWQLLVVILLGTLGVMVGTALVVERVVRLEQRLLRRDRP